MKLPLFAFLGLTALLASGCASRPYDGYEDATRRASIAQLCNRQGLVSNEDFALYTDLQMGWGPRQFTSSIDPAKMESMYLDKVAQLNRWEPATQTDKERLRLQCADETVVAGRLKGNNRSTPSIPAISLPTTTNCMTTYGWTRCTTN